MNRHEIADYLDDEYERRVTGGEIKVTFDCFNDEGYACSFVTFTPDYVDGERNRWGESYTNSTHFVIDAGGVEDDNGDIVELSATARRWIDKVCDALPCEPLEEIYNAARA